MASPDLDGFVRYDSPRVTPHPNNRQRSPRQGGGVCIYVRQSLAPCVTEWKRTHCGDVLWLRADLPGLPRPYYIAGCYILPSTSIAPPTYPSSTDRWDLLSADVQIASSLGPVLMGGDFNARLLPGDEDRSFNEVGPLPPELQLQPPDTSWAPPRRSRDHLGNPFGPRLATMCRDHGLLILNGRSKGDRKGRYTRVSGTSRTVLDYWVCSAEAYNSVQQLSVERILNHRDQELRVSDHRPVLLVMRLPLATDPPPIASSTRPKYRDDKDSELGSHLLSAFESMEYGSMVDDPDMPTEVLAGTFLDCLEASIQRVYTRPSPAPRSPRRRGRPPWFDDDCRELQRQRNAALAACTSPEERASVFRWYRSRMGFKTWCYHRNKIDSLVHELRSNPRRLAQRLRPKDRAGCPCSPDDLRHHFEALFAPPPDPDPPTRGPITVGTSAAFRHRVPPTESARITREEDIPGPFSTTMVAQATARLRNHAAYDGHGLCAEFLKAIASFQSDHQATADAQPRPLLVLLTSLLNRFFHDGFPTLFASAEIVPIHKKGDRADPSNYRGIAIISIIAKLYASLLEKRLSVTLEVHRARALTQAGFRPKRSTTDQILVLQQLIDIQCRHRPPLAKKRTGRVPKFHAYYGTNDPTKRSRTPPQLFACFVDFSKAFDSVPRALLQERLERVRVPVLLREAIGSYYANVQLRVRTQAGLSGTFQSTAGVKQGCPLSPTLFGLFIDHFEEFLANSDGPIGTLYQEHPEHAVYFPRLLLYADDIVLLGRTAEELQCLVDCLAKFCSVTGMTVNQAKTQVVVFRKGPTAVSPSFRYAGRALDVVDEYRYLGFYFHAWKRPHQHGFPKLLDSAQRAANWLSGRCHALGIRDLAAALRLFNMYVRPILLYACHVWLPFLPSALVLGNSPLEKVQLSFIKSFLRLPPSTATASLLWETGAAPVLPFALRIIGRYFFYTFFHWKCYRFSTPFRSGMNNDSPSRYRDTDYRFLVFLRSLNEYEFVTTKVPSSIFEHTWVHHLSSLLSFCNVSCSQASLSTFNLGSVLFDFSSRKFSNQLSSLSAHAGTVHQQFRHVRFSTPGCAPYLWNSRSTVNRDLILRLRLSVLQLDLHRQRRAGIPPDARSSCPCCASHNIESEKHFLMECSLYTSLRFNRKFRYLFTRPAGGPATDSELSDLLRTDSYDSLGQFIYIALQRRRTYLNLARADT